MATVCGFVVVGAEIIDARADADATTVLELRPAGGWFETFRERRLSTGPGRSWVIRGWQPFAKTLQQ
ncbi:MAG: hypothetical protein WKF50_11060 [Nocardioides sp.]